MKKKLFLLYIVVSLLCGPNAFSSIRKLSRDGLNPHLFVNEW